MMNIRKLTPALTVLALMGLLLTGCGTEQSSPSEPAPQETPNATEEKQAAAPKYITAAEDFSNLQLDDPSLPVYDKLTLSERRQQGLPTALPQITPYKAKKVAYLTFDDGPDDNNTAAILDILKEENVKATFYVLGKNVATYPAVAKRIFDEGHALGNHSYSHDYDRLYPNVNNFIAEMEKTDEIIRDLIGVRPLIIRAPGGRMGHFNQEYLTALANNGYVEHDWNVSSADTAPNHPVAQDFVDNIQYQSVMDSAIILMHCSAAHEETVKALPKIIQVLKEQGYSFGVITPMTPQPW